MEPGTGGEFDSLSGTRYGLMMKSLPIKMLNMRVATSIIILSVLFTVASIMESQYWLSNRLNIALLHQVMQSPPDCFDIGGKVLATNLTLHNRRQLLCDQSLTLTSDSTPIDTYTLAVSHLHQGNVDLAIDLFKEINVSSHVILSLRIEPGYRDNPAKLASLVAVALQLPFYRESGNNPYRHILAAINDYLDWGLPMQAAELHEFIAYHEPPSELRHWLSATDAAQLRGEIDKANDLYAEAKKIWPDELLLHRRHGSLLLRENRWQDAIRAGQEWLIVHPEDGRAMSQIGQAYYRFGEYGEAELWLNQALIQLPTTDMSSRVVIENMLSDISAWKN